LSLGRWFHMFGTILVKKVKDKVRLCLCMPWMSGDGVQLFHNRGIRWMKVRNLYPQGKNPWYPLNKRLCGHHSWSWCYR